MTADGIVGEQEIAHKTPLELDFLAKIAQFASTEYASHMGVLRGYPTSQHPKFCPRPAPDKNQGALFVKVMAVR